MQLKVPITKYEIDFLTTCPKIDAREDYKINFRNRILITLNLVHFPDNRRVKDYKSNYFAQLNGADFEKIFSKKGWTQTKNHLIKKYKVIEANKYEKGVSSKGYRLTINNQGPEFAWELLTTEGSVYNHFLEYIENNKLLSKQKNEKVDYLFSQFEKSKLFLDKGVYDFVRSYQSELFKLNENLNSSEDSYYGILNLVGSYLLDIDRFNKGKDEPFIAKSNNRLYSVINTIKKEIRYYIRNGENNFMEYDLSASYNYVLASILNYEFFTSTTNSYSLSNVFNILYSRLLNLISINNKNELINISYMSPTYWKSEDIGKYKELPFEHDVYQWIRKMIVFDDDLSNRFKTNDRSAIKDEFKKYFNLSESVIREGTKSKKATDEAVGLPIVQFMKKHFPNVNNLVSKLIFLNGIKSPLSLLMQRCEAYLVQEIAAKHLIEQHPDQLVFTIHDSLFIESKPGINPDLIVNEMKNVLNDFTGIMPGVKNKSVDPMSIISEIVNEDFQMVIKDLSSSKPFEVNTKIKKSITAAIKFMHAKSKKDLKAEKIKFQEFCEKISSENPL